MTPFRQLQAIIAADLARMQILRQVRALELADCWVAAGFVRSAVWDHLHQRDHSPLPPDIDVIWFDSAQTDPAVDVRIEAALRQQNHTAHWSVKNQARMHLRNADAPYTSASDAMRHWPETATAVAVRLDAEGRLEVAAPLGLDDLFALRVRPTASFREAKRQIYLSRLQTKNWSAQWPRLRFLD